MSKTIIVLEGGLVQEVHSEVVDLDVEVLDLDALEECDKDDPHYIRAKDAKDALDNLNLTQVY